MLIESDIKEPKNLNQEETNGLLIIGEHFPNTIIEERKLMQLLNGKGVVKKYMLEKLCDMNLIDYSSGIRENNYQLTQTGRAYLIDKKMKIKDP